MEGTDSPEAALQAAGLYFDEGAIAWLTPAQKDVLLAELEDMEVCDCCIDHMCVVPEMLGSVTHVIAGPGSISAVLLSLH